uniref:Uncharacterized protein n=1 Tax=Acrobeloides nanus TaxID=290746 RepID=A0A914DHM4_9BILA
MIDKSLTDVGLKDILSLTIPGQTIRECSCREDHECVNEIKEEVFTCADKCWYKFREITNNPLALKACIDAKENIFNDFVTCVQGHLDSCVNDMNGPQIPKHDLLKMLAYGEQKIVASREGLLKNAVMRPIKHILETTLEFGACVKDCFLTKNRDGFCFDRIGCQPLITEDHAMRTLKHCIKQLDWKREASSLCDCSVNAGVSTLERYCPMLRLMSQRGGRRQG